MEGISKSIAAPKTAVINILLFTLVFALVAVWVIPIPAFQNNRISLSTILGINIIFHTLFWYVIFKLLNKQSAALLGWTIFVTFCIYVLLLALASYYSQVVLIPLLFISTVIVFNNWVLIFFTSIQLLIINILVDLGLVSGQIGLDWAQNITLLNLAVGLIAIVASFQLKERELKLEHLEEVTKIKNTFIGAISHNLRTPITAILGYSEILMKDFKNLSSDQNTIVNNIKTNANNLALLIEDTISVSSIESGMFKLRVSTFSLKELLEEVVSVGFRTIAQSRESEVIGPLPEEKDITIQADRERLKIVISNLLDNALKYTTRGRIKISIEQNGEGALIKVSDSGKGILPEAQKQLFEQFSRPEGILQYHQTGTGLGLYIARLIIEAHHGKISLSSDIASGTTFFIQLPLLQPQNVENVVDLEGSKPINNESSV